VYDAIVIGGQLGGVMAATLLARRGMQVLFIDHDTGAAPYQHAEWKLSHAPFLIPGLKQLSVFDELLTEVGLLSTVQRVMQPVTLQVINAKSRFELHAEAEPRGKELKRALNAGADSFESMWQNTARVATDSDAFFSAKPDLPPEGWFARWRFRRTLPRFSAALEADSPLRNSTLLELTPYLTGLENPGTLSVARALGKTLSSPHLVSGGREGLHHVFTERARELGVDVLGPGDTIEALSFEGSKPVGIRLTRNDTVYRGAFIVAACDVATLCALVPQTRQKPLEKWVSALEARRGVFTMNAVVPERALPRGLGTLAVIDSPDTELGGLLVQVSPAEPAADRILSISAKVPLALRAGGEPAVKALMTRVWSAVDSVMPFTRKHVRLESSAWMDAPRVVAGAFEPLPLQPAIEPSVLGVSALTVSSPYQRLLFANRQVLPGLGFEGEVLTALRAVRHIERVLHKNDPLKNRRPAA
jgi:hypothetical protein